MRSRAEFGLVSITIGALGIGYALYAVARPQTQSLLLWHLNVPTAALPSLPAWLLGSAPSFVHTLAFAILLAIVAGRDRRTRAKACAAWGAIEIAAECAQLPTLGQWLAGTFTVPDVIAVVTGTMVAIRCVHVLSKETSHEDSLAFDVAHIGRDGRARSRFL
jgi:hypothetical protein